MKTLPRHLYITFAFFMGGLATAVTCPNHHFFTHVSMVAISAVVVLITLSPISNRDKV